jgi:copper ion binding protein
MKYALPAVLTAAALFLTPAILRANRGAECSVAAQACGAAAKSYTISAEVTDKAAKACPVSGALASEGCSKAAVASTSAAACSTTETTHPISATVASEGCNEVKAAACSTSAAACSTTQTTHPISATVASECCSEAKSVKLTKAEFEVNGLGGAGCVSKVTKALMEVEGVNEAQACSASKQVKVAYDSKRAKEKAVVAAIVKAGFQVSAETVELKVSGMECGACSTTVGKSLAALEGVKEQKVCHAGNNAVVKFDPNLISRDQLVAAIGKTGFTVTE